MDRKKSKSEHRHSKHEIETETDLMLHLLADKGKLKPIEKTINVIHVDDEETALEAGLKRKSHNDEISFDGSESISVKSSSSSSSSSYRQKQHISSKSHTKLDRIIEEYNDKSSKASSSSNSSNSSKTSSSSSRSSNSKSSNATTITVQSRRERTEKQEKKEEPISPKPKWTNEREKKIYKMELYYALQEYKKRRILTRDYPPSSSIEDMEDEVLIQQKIDSKEEGIMLAREGLMKFSTIIVKANKTWDYFGLKLDGWDKQMEGNINNYNPVLGRLYDKYSHLFFTLEPEYIFLWMFVGSAFSFHYAKKYVEENGLEELVKQNPELMSKIQSTIASTIESKVSSQLNKKNPEEKKPGLSHAEMYKKYKEMQEAQGNGTIYEEDEYDDEIEKSVSADVDNTINEMLKQNTTFVAPPKLPLSQRTNQSTLAPRAIDGSKRVNEMMTNVNRKNTIPLSETSGVLVETVDSESIEKSNLIGRGKNKTRLHVTRTK